MFDHSLDVFYSPLALDFYKENEHQLLSKLLLKHSRDSLKKDLSLQLESRRRADGKLPTWLETSNIVFPPKLNLEQASSEQTASFKAKLVKYNTSLDLTAGTGVDSWQFSKNAKKHTLVEADSGLVELAKHNFGVLGIKNTEFVAKTQFLLQTMSRNKIFFKS